MLQVLIAVVGLSGGSAGCEFIHDSDMRHYCRAISLRRPTECEFIRQTDLRIRCRMEAVRKEPIS